MPPWVNKKRTAINYYYITGTSKGIGKAVVQELLKDSNNYIIGISRTNSFEYKNFRHIALDLSDLDAVKNFRFESHTDAGRIVLINNAGTFSEIRRVGKLKDDSVSNTYNINVTSPCILMNRFIKAYRDVNVEKIIFNVTSHAARYPMDAVACYSSSKAALDMFSRIVAQEQEITGGGVKIFSVAPGAVDTEMQTQTRMVDKNEFSLVEQFKAYQKEGHLTTPEYTAKKFIEIIEHSKQINEVVFSIGEFEKMKTGW